MLSFFQSLFGRGRCQPARRMNRKSCPQLEALEDRCVPATNALFVTSPLDNGAVGTLRYELAHASPGATIDIEPQWTTVRLGNHYVHEARGMNIVLTRGELDLKQNVTIQGIAGPAISGHLASRVFEVAKGVDATLDDLTITAGGATSKSSGGANGGGILNYGTLTLNGCTLSGNKADAGAALYNHGGNVAMDNTTLTNNSAQSSGGAICSAYFGTVSVTDSTLSHNSARNGGAIWFDDGTVTLTGDTFSSNTATGHGGALDNDGSGTLSVGQSTFTGNSPKALFGSYVNDGGNTGL
jgi:predicted outer membrane repeat protein